MQSTLPARRSRRRGVAHVEVEDLHPGELAAARGITIGLFLGAATWLVLAALAAFAALILSLI